jgi:signal transduction histidine kinase
MNDLLPGGAAMPAVLHELRTWTNSVSMWTRILKRHRSAVDVDRALRAIERSAAAMERFIADLGILSRGAGTPFGLYLENVNLLTVVEDALDVVRPKADLKEISLLWMPQGGGAPVVCGDQLRMQQIICNLLMNAVQFSPPGSRIAITLTTTKEYARIAIEDSGPGISRAFLPSIFEPFAQDPGVHHVDGSGLGLAIAKTLAELQQGRLDVDPGGEGRGAVFHVQLPLVPHQASAAYA